MAEMLPNMRQCGWAGVAGAREPRATCAIGRRNRGLRLPHAWPASGGEPRSPLTAHNARRTSGMIAGRAAGIGAMKSGAVGSVRPVACGKEVR